MLGLLSLGYDSHVTGEGIGWRSYGDPSKPMLFLIPGGAGVPFPYDYPEPLEPHAFVVTYDACGVRDSDTCSMRSDWSAFVSDASHVLDAALAEYGHASVVLAGYSGGNFVADQMAKQVSVPVRAMVLISPVMHFEKALDTTKQCLSDRLGYARWMVDSFPDSLYFSLSQLLCGSYCAQTRAIWNAPFCPIPWNVDWQSLLQGFRQRTRILDEYHEQNIRGNFASNLHIISGAYDQIAPYDLVRASISDGSITAPNIATTVLGSSSHHPRYEDEEEFVKAVAAAMA